MTAPKTVGYGSWKSPISSDVVASGGIALERPIVLDDNNVYWIESRPTEGGRSVIVRWSITGGIVDVTPASFNARTRVHEYGGGAFTVESGTVYFSNFVDQLLYRQNPDAEPQAMTPATALRYADAIVDRHRRRIICVCEDHTNSGHEAVNSLVAIGLDGGGVSQPLVSGNDFYSSPRLSPDGSRLGMADLEPSPYALRCSRALGWRDRGRWLHRPGNANYRRLQLVCLPFAILT